MPYIKYGLLGFKIAYDNLRSRKLFTREAGCDKFLRDFSENRYFCRNFH